ncbi:MAG TPA: arsenate reductase ArsC [Saprospiraceae bacterium]|nr:arsenate reductase ArsC [Saprospiraceae bacterium]
MVNVLIICADNSVRSQIAEAYFTFYAKGKGLFFSAGLKPGEMSPYAVKVMAEDNIDLTEHSVKSIQAFRNVPFDQVITVCQTEDSTYLEQLHFQHWHHIPVSAPSERHYSTEAEAMEAYRITRDQLKRKVLRFIGQELSQPEEQTSLS